MLTTKTLFRRIGKGNIENSKQQEKKTDQNKKEIEKLIQEINL